MLLSSGVGAVIAGGDRDNEWPGDVVDEALIMRHHAVAVGGRGNVASGERASCVRR
jgi:hypothetical protein